MAGIPKAWQPNFNPPPPRTTQSRVMQQAASATPKPTVVRAAPPPRADFRTYYDPSRVVDLDRIKVVKDLRETGETQSGDNGVLGPGSTGGAYAGMDKTPKIAPVVQQNKIAPWLLAAAAYFILGG